MPSYEAAIRHGRARGRALLSIRPCCCRGGMSLSLILSLFNHSIQVPEIFPCLVLFPQKDLPFDKTAVLVDSSDVGHIRVAQRCVVHGMEICETVACVF